MRNQESIKSANKIMTFNTLLKKFVGVKDITNGIMQYSGNFNLT